MTPSPATRPLICGVDFSDNARRAVAFSARLAHRLGASLVAATAVDPLLLRAADLRLEPGRFAADTLNDLEAFVAESAPAEARPAVLTSRVLVGDAARALVDLAASEDAALIVVGTGGRGWLSRLALGSTTARLLRANACPVLAVPAPPAADDGPPTPARIVCGIDFAPASVAAAREAVALGARLGLPVTLVHVVPALEARPGWEAPVEAALAENRAGAEARLAALAADFSPRPATEVVTGDAAAALVAAAGPDALVVVGLAGQPGHRPGTTASRVLASGSAPVLAVPADATPGPPPA